MKKIYISPETEFVECIPCTMIAASLPIDNSGPSTEDEFEGEATGAVRGDWENIWQGM
jgi:hypothetical protein